MNECRKGVSIVVRYIEASALSSDDDEESNEEDHQEHRLSDYVRCRETVGLRGK